MQHLLRRLLLVLAGAAQTLSFSPFEWWIAAPLSILAILILCIRLEPGTLFRAGWLVGLGLFGSGASWVYVSIYHHGIPSIPIAGAMTLIFVAGLALFTGLVFWCWGKLAGNVVWRRLALFPVVWILGDWLRGWILTGFPWLFLGTSQVDGPMAGWAPVLGVHGVTMLILVSTALVFAAIRSWLAQQPRLTALLAALALAPWLAGPALNTVQYTAVGEEPITFAAIQGNIPQEVKWNPDALQRQINTYLNLSEPHWGKDVILWPETAVPTAHTHAADVLDYLDERGLESDTTLLTGVPWFGRSDDQPERRFHNSLLAAGRDGGVYHKQRLVPFGEYVPLERWLRGTFDFFDLPLSSFTPGPSQQPPMSVGGIPVHPFICYEIAYADFVARHANGTGYLVTVSNDAWFGRSFGPLQHLQIARMRALETQRYMLRGTNNGVTAVVDDRGRIQDQAPQFEQTTLTGELYPAWGRTPFMATGSWPVLTIAAIVIVFTRRRKEPRKD